MPDSHGRKCKDSPELLPDLCRAPGCTFRVHYELRDDESVERRFATGELCSSDGYWDRGASRIVEVVKGNRLSRGKNRVGWRKRLERDNTGGAGERGGAGNDEVWVGESEAKERLRIIPINRCVRYIA